jgi:hypothetical protein
VQRHQSRLPEFRVPDDENAAVGVEVAVVEGERFADPDAFSQGSQPVA